MKISSFRNALAALLIGSGSMAFAQAVELTSNDGTLSVAGNLVGFDGDSYTLATNMGHLVIDADQVSCSGIGCPVLEVPVDPNVELVSIDGNVTLSGIIVDFDGSTYTLGTILGNLEVDALQVVCIGETCPEVIEGAPSVRVSGDPSITSSLMASLLSEFSESVGGELEIAIDESNQEMLSVLDGGGEKVMDMTLADTQATQSLRDLLDGNADLAILTRPISTRERSEFLAQGLGDLVTPEQQIIFGLDGIVVVTSESNPVRALSKQALAQIFSGEITNWSQVGGTDAPINVFVRGDDTGTGAMFNAIIMFPESRSFAPTATLMNSDDEMAELVAADPLAIGFTGLASAGNAKILDIRDACGIQIPASSFTIKTEEYPLTKRLFVYTTNARRAPQLTRFLEFLAADAAQDTIARSGLVDLGVSYQSNNEQGLRYLAAIVQTDGESSLREMRTMTESFLSSDRLSLTLRFALGSSQLDDRARDDIQRLVRHITTNDLVNKELLLVGFTDSIGNAAANLNLSRERAASVRDSLVAALPSGSQARLPINSLGFGELSPLSCNDAANGRRINRRVEVWLRDTVSTSN